MSLMFFGSYFKFDGNSSCYNSIRLQHICTCHDSTAVMSCARFFAITLLKIESKTKCPSDLNCDRKPLVKWSLGPCQLVNGRQ